MSAYYNENDPFAAAWLQQLIVKGHIASGVVDTRSIVDVRSSDLKGFTQCHFFAGIGIWPLAARIVGWPDDRPLDSGSCPCPPFSSAGPTFRCPVCDTASPVPNAVRTGAFDCIRCGHEWQADSRHLWPEFRRILADRGDVPVVGEQVASRDGRTWVDLVRASLEMLGRAVGVVDTCAAGFGAPHIRQRIYWMADAAALGCERRRSGETSNEPGTIERFERFRDANRLVDSDQPGLEGHSGHGDDRYQPGRLDAQSDRYAGTAGTVSGLADADSGERGGIANNRSLGDGKTTRWIESNSSAQSCSEASRLADASRIGQRESGECNPQTGSGRSEERDDARNPGPTNGLWRDADWLYCRDGKWRPVEPGTFPLANARTFRNRVAELRGSGNAVNVAQAAGFLRAVMAALS